MLGGGKYFYQQNIGGSILSLQLANISLPPLPSPAVKYDQSLAGWYAHADIKILKQTSLNGHPDTQ